MFDTDKNLDEESYGRHWNWLITQQGADGLVIAGTSGEFIAMDFEERVRVFRLVKSVVRGECPFSSDQVITTQSLPSSFQRKRKNWGSTA
jgi:dihydrodipicolinate synthase/N-acetylneuraminate lyase